jgi:hypothetical protein
MHLGNVGLIRHYTGYLMMEALHTSETSVYFYEFTLRNIPDICHCHTRRRVNLKSHIRDCYKGLYSDVIGPLVDCWQY